MKQNLKCPGIHKIATVVMFLHAITIDRVINNIDWIQQSNKAKRNSQHFQTGVGHSSIYLIHLSNMLNPFPDSF